MLVLISWWRPPGVSEERGQILCPVAERKKDKLGDKVAWEMAGIPSANICKFMPCLWE